MNVLATNTLPHNSAILDGRTSDEVRDIYDFTLDILEKKYNLYEWTHNKLNTLVSINSLVIGGILVLSTSDKFKLHETRLDHVLFVLPIITLVTSIGMSLWSTLPKMDAGIGNRQFRNLRQVVGTDTYTPVQYLDTISGLTLRDMVVQNVNQIKGMNRIIMKNQLELRRVTFLVLISFALIIVWIAYTLR